MTRGIRNHLAVLLVLLAAAPAAWGQKEYGFDNRKASGQPYLKPEESIRRMQVQPGWEVAVFAAEPEVVNPIAFTVDERGRIWVVECFEYPRRTPKDRMPRDRIKVLEDTDGDGRCDKVTVFAEGKDFPVRFDMASGIEVGHGGVFLGAPPYLFFLRDTDGDGRCDKHEILLSGFGSQDTHETLNTFQWGPDGRLYGLHGVFTHSEVQGVKLNAAVWRYDVRSRKFEVFAEGTSNPWGMDFDAHGQCFLCCCVIPHLFHLSPGGVYIRQAGASFNPYAYGLLKEICDHTHHKESGWAHAGLLVLEGKQVPEDLRGGVLMGSIHGTSIKRDTLRPNGSTFRAGHAADFLVSGDKNFRPINLRWAPDGSIYVIDWHDQNPCHQAAPDSWDQEHGRVYRLHRSGARPGPAADLGKKTNDELADLLLSDDNPFRYRTALRLLSERRGQLPRELAEYLRRRALQPGGELVSLRALWGLHGVGAFGEDAALELLGQADPAIRLWTVRFASELDRIDDSLAARLAALAAAEASPAVRLELASAAQRLPPPRAIPIIANLLKHGEDVQDPVLPLMLWLAFEHAAFGQAGGTPARAEVDWIMQHAPGNPLITQDIVPRLMRRLAATGRPDDLAVCMQFLDGMTEVAIRRQALAGLVEALKQRQVAPPTGWERVHAELRASSDPEVLRLAQQLAVIFKSAEAVQRSLAVLRGGDRPKPERLDAIRDLGVAHPAEGLQPLLDVLLKDPDEDLKKAAAAALARFEAANLGDRVLAAWKSYPPSVRVELISVLKSRRDWARQLLNAVGAGQVPAAELTNNTILAIRSFKDPQLDALIKKVWGQYRDTPAEIEKLIGQMHRFMHEGPGDAERGRLAFEKHCMQCHRFEGKGHEVGPNLDGAERSIDYLLINILDPNRVVGQPYFTRTILLKSGQLVTGLSGGEDANTVSIKRENGVAEVIPRNQIEADKLESRSLMPEGLGNNLTSQELRDLVRYLMANPFLTEVRLSEPIRGKGAFDRVLAIESSERSDGTTVRFQPLAVGPAGRIPLNHGMAEEETGEYARYVLAEIESPAAVKTLLRIGNNGRVRVWLNGKLLQALPASDKTATPDGHSLEAALQQGVNRLLIKAEAAGPGSALYARFLDPDRKLRVRP